MAEKKTKSVQIGASILCADFTCLAREIRRCEEARVDRIHVDVMDGHFVPVITMGPLIVKAVRAVTDLPIEVHLMIEQPWAHLDAFIEAGGDIIGVHAECYGPRREGCRQYGEFPKEVDAIDEYLLGRDIQRIQDAGRQAYVVLNPGTPLCLDATLSDLDGVLVMSVNPGFSYQRFMPEVLDKVKALRKQFDKDIAIDGGINAETAAMAVEAGVNVLDTASYLFGAEDMHRATLALRSLVENS